MLTVCVHAHALVNETLFRKLFVISFFCFFVRSISLCQQITCNNENEKSSYSAEIQQSFCANNSQAY